MVMLPSWQREKTNRPRRRAQNRAGGKHLIKLKIQNRIASRQRQRRGRSVQQTQLDGIAPSLIREKKLVTERGQNTGVARRDRCRSRHRRNGAAVGFGFACHYAALARSNSRKRACVSSSL